MEKSGSDRITSRPLPMRQVHVTDGFWKREQEVVRTAILPYQWDALNDRIPDAAPSYCMHNFRAAAALTKKKNEAGIAFVPPAYTNRGFETLPEDPAHPDEDKFFGFVFQDSDFSKWIEAVGYSLINHPDSALEAVADGAIDIVCAAQQENGYLDTYYILNGMDRAFTNLKDHHELYCMGHLIEGAVSYFQATGKDKLLRAAMRFADYAVRFFLEEGNPGYPGHEIAEMALARLFEATGEKRYLDLAAHFIDARGQRPLLFEPRIRKKGFDPFTASYHQAHQPVREQKEAVGHAVRAVYLYSGMADVARLTGDETLLKACRNIWDSITQTKLYVTGGIGGTYLGESFSYPYDLPADSAYSETCAAIGLVFFARRMLQLDPDAKYGDVMELALYNTVLAGKAMDGKSFFYVNPLEADPATLPLDGRLEHVVVPRQKWFGCACCPPNIARTVSSVQSYAYTASADTLFVHLYLDSEVNVDLGGRALSLTTSTAYPWDGAVRLRVHAEGADEAAVGTSAAMTGETIALRIPGWCRTHSVKILDADGNDAEGKFVKKYDRGYLYLTGSFTDETIELSLDLAVRILTANNAVKEMRGMAALARGPVTYCLEEADNGKDLHLLSLDIEAVQSRGIRTKSITIGGQEMIALEVPGFRELSERGGPLYRELVVASGMDAESSSEQASEPDLKKKRDEATLTFVPYYAWDNRGSGEMRVYVPLA